MGRILVNQGIQRLLSANNCKPYLVSLAEDGNTAPTSQEFLNSGYGTIEWMVEILMC